MKIITYTTYKDGVTARRSQDLTTIQMDGDSFMRENTFTHYIDTGVHTVIHDEPRLLTSIEVLSLYNMYLSFKTGDIHKDIVIKGHHPNIEEFLFPIIRDIKIESILEVSLIEYKL